MDSIPKGKRFSLLYVQTEEAIVESTRLKNRLIELFKRIVDQNSASLGLLVERELGVKVLASGINGAYLSWIYFKDLETRDYLDTVTLCKGFIRNGHPLLSLTSLVSEFNRIFTEEKSAYIIVDQLGVHPSVDPSFRANLGSSVRRLGSSDYSAARSHIERADNSLLPQKDRREAIKAIFDAVENIFKQTFTNATSINSATIQTNLKPAVENIYSDGVEKRSALKMVDSLKDWVDSCHNYRHEPGDAEPSMQTEELAVVLVSNGISFARWLADIRPKLN